MRVYKCDRCGKFFRRDELMVMTTPILPVYFNFRIKRHVCGDCASDFKRWWDSSTGSEVTAKLLRKVAVE